MHWPSEDGWVFDMNAVYPVAFDADSHLPIVPFQQAIQGGLPFGLELLYPKVPWVRLPWDAKVEQIRVTGREHLKNQTEMLKKLRQWGRIR